MVIMVTSTAMTQHNLVFVVDVATIRFEQKTFSTKKEKCNF
jgi:hypothetical protein